MRFLIVITTVFPRIEAPGVYWYKRLGPPACIRGPAFIRGPASINTNGSDPRCTVHEYQQYTGCTVLSTPIPAIHWLYSTEYTNTGLLFETRPVFEVRRLFEARRLLVQTARTLGLYLRPGVYSRPGYYSRKYGSWINYLCNCALLQLGNFLLSFT